MAATARKIDAAAASTATRDFIDHGYHVFPGGVDPVAADRLLAKLKATRDWDHSLFLTEAAFDADPQYTGVNPKPGRNLLEGLDEDLAFVEQDPGIVAGLTEVLGPGYELMNRKVVCGVPARSVPAWLKARITDNPVNNLGAYVKPQYRDVTYFYGIDFHQDLIDFKDREADFITLYVYIHPVTRHDAPLFLLEDSHVLGATVFPHDLEKNDRGWLYRDGKGGWAQTTQKLLVGDAGYAAMWHACTLHGTQPDAADNERLSLRYLYAKAPGAKGAGIDAVNASLRGPTMLSSTRQDLDARGAARIKANSVNKA
ncbi:hypothetical protein ACO2Q3_21995 [Caulobacter sp. KR2-114]|uniref:hypothetical protein n=1 Tax=Caulobacter sp. KR2-114 TaxID=3400912 RepID=UPI003C0CB4E5